MAEGNDTFLRGGVPIEGSSEIRQKELSLDILTITGKPGQTGDFLVLQNSSGTERLVIDKDGNFDASNLTITGTFGVVGSLTQSTGAVTLKGATAISGTLSLTNTLYVGNTTTGQPMQLFGNLTQSNGTATIKGTTSVTGAATFSSTIHGTGAVTLASNLTMSGGAGRLALKKNATHAAATPFSKLSLAMLHTTPTSAAGVVTGDIFLFHVTTDIWRIAVCMSGAASLFHRARRAVFDVTLGSAS